MFVRDMKSIIKYAIELDIDYLETFLGYEGDNVLKITTRSADATKLYEENVRGTLAELIAHFSSKTVKGEIVIVVGGKLVEKKKKEYIKKDRQ